jgi:uncharacterized protein (TIGR02996 family)
MNEQAALIRAICESPPDDTVRLAYADWLEENPGPLTCPICNGSGVRPPLNRFDCLACHGRKVLDRCPREGLAKFIRCQIGWHNESDPIESARLSLAMREAIRGNGRVWAGAAVSRVCSSGLSWTFDRGMVKEVHLAPTAFMQSAEELFRSQPITSIRVREVGPTGPAFSDQFTWGWCNSSYWNCHAWEIPNEIWYRLPKRKTNSTVVYDTEKEALDDLDAACVSYGRSLAGLPELESVS